MRGKRFIQWGKPPTRQVLYMAALTAAYRNEILSPAYKQMVEIGKPKKVALVAIMRRLLIHLNSIMIKVLREGNESELRTS